MRCGVGYQAFLLTDVGDLMVPLYIVLGVMRTGKSAKVSGVSAPVMESPLGHLWTPLSHLFSWSHLSLLLLRIITT